VNKELIHKIEALFELRQLPWLLSLGEGLDADRQDFYQRLIQLQYHIYELDKYLEETWKPDSKIISGLWSTCEDQLTGFGYRPEQIKSLLHSFYIYMQRELAIRKGKTPASLNIRAFYWHKSCDVKLMRQLVYDRYPEVTTQIPKSSWIAFDYMTEIMDDVEDLAEDLKAYNGNRLLFALRERNAAEVRSEYQAFLEWIVIRSGRDSHRWPGWMLDAFHFHVQALRQDLARVKLPDFVS